MSSPEPNQGRICFVTVAGDSPRVVESRRAAERLAWLKDTLAEMAGDITIEDMERNSFHHAVHKALIAAFRNAFSPRREGKFVPLLQVVYSDSLRMVTVGGVFISDGLAVQYRDRVKRVMPFLNTIDPVLYRIKSLHQTERERALFDRAVTSGSRRRSEKGLLKGLGFSEEDLKAYKDLVRYLPRYVETIV